MPYTPPAVRSPSASVPPSPDRCRSSSMSHPSRPTLPRSASYLAKHRRSPSAKTFGSTSDDQPWYDGGNVDNSSSVHVPAAGYTANGCAGHPPMTAGDDEPMSKAVTLSHGSASSGGDDEEALEIRGRHLDHGKVNELKQAVLQLSPNTPTLSGSPVLTGQPVMSLPPRRLRDLRDFGSLSHLNVDNIHRKIGHVRSESAVNLTTPTRPEIDEFESQFDSDSDASDDECARKPQIVRKKSGELVRPALRPSSRRRPSSMPGTPTFAKAVHFDSHLEHVRHFLQVDRPLAVSGRSSPVEAYDSDVEFPIQSENQDGDSGVRSPQHEWEVIMSNFPLETPARQAQPIRLEKVWLSPIGQKSLIGTIAVANLAYTKYVTCRFTFDYWKTTSEVAAHFIHEIVASDEQTTGQDRFTFSVKLSDISNLETRTLLFCLRYNVDGQEFWDNNGIANFQVDFKRLTPPNSAVKVQRVTGQPVESLPRSNRRRTPSTGPHSQSTPPAVPLAEPDDQSSNKPGLQLKAKSSSSLTSDCVENGVRNPKMLAFANRYDFGASLRAAKDARVKLMNLDGLYMRPISRREHPLSSASSNAEVCHDTTDAANVSGPLPNLRRTAVRQGDIALPMSSSKPEVPPAGIESPSSIMASSSYEELLNKYCFFGSKQNSPTLKDGSYHRTGAYDGAGDGDSQKSSFASTPSPTFAQLNGPAKHHSVPRGLGPNFLPGLSAASSPPVGSHPLVTSAVTGSDRVEKDGSGSRPGASTSPPLAANFRRSPSPPSTVGSVKPFAAGLPTEFRFHAQRMHDRYPFVRTESHSPTAIQG